VYISTAAVIGRESKTGPVYSLPSENQHFEHFKFIFQKVSFAYRKCSVWDIEE
jgi:hypothetical protein